MTKKIEAIDPGSVYGRARLWRVSHCDDPPPLFLPNIRRPVPTGKQAWVPIGPWQNNLLLYSWAAMASHLFRGSPDGKKYHVSGGYIEFDNSGSSITPPVPARNAGHSYYNSLVAPQDYLRVPITATVHGSSGVNFPDGNVATFFLQTSGSVGFKNGLTFSDAANSRVFGVGLVAMPVPGDDSQDIIFNRLYFAQADQVPKLAGSQIGVTVEVVFG